MFGRKIFSQTHSNKAGNGFENLALSNRVFNNGYSKHFRDMTSGENDKRTHLNKARNGFENSKGA